jgi:hypothetical protein
MAGRRGEAFSNGQWRWQLLQCDRRPLLPHAWPARLGYPEIMTQGETLEELEDNLRDAFRLMVLDEVPEDYQMKEIAL